MCRVVCLLLVFISGCVLSAQVTVSRDATAVSLADQAVTLLGGSAVYAQISGVLATGTITPASGSTVPAGTFRWRNAGKEFRDFRYSFTTADGTKILASGIRPGVHSEKGKNFLLPRRFRYSNPPFFVPGLVLKSELNDPHLNFTDLGTVTWLGSQVHAIKITTIRTDRQHAILSQIWYFNPGAALPLGVCFRSPMPGYAAVYQHITLLFSAFSSQQGISFPSQITVMSQRQALSLDIVQNVQFNPAPGSNGFVLPGVKP